MSEENVVPDSTQDVSPEVAVEEPSVIEDSQPPVDETSESSPETEETVVDAVQKALSEDDEPTSPDATEESKANEELPEQEAKVEVESKDKTKPEPDNAEPEIYQEPENLQPKASQRFRDLVADNKAKTGELVQATEAVSQIQKSVTESGLSPNEFATLLDYGKLAVSTDRSLKEQALQFAQSEVQRLSKEMGVEVEGVDLLDDFNDLKDQVDNYELSREHAVELANSRRSQQVVESQNQQVQQQQQQQHQNTQVVQSAAKEIESFMESHKKTDIDFDAKEKYLMGQVDYIQKNYQPSQWSSVVAQLYSAVGSMSSAQTQQLKKTSPTPLSSSGVTAGAANAGSMADAVMAELSGG
tara:strand:+ start:932 stop:1999 length:1068 start_codon:yes stop_codon:yes gene_type:complete